MSAFTAGQSRALSLRLLVYLSHDLVPVALIFWLLLVRSLALLYGFPRERWCRIDVIVVHWRVYTYSWGRANKPGTTMALPDGRQVAFSKVVGRMTVTVPARQGSGPSYSRPPAPGTAVEADAGSKKPITEKKRQAKKEKEKPGKRGQQKKRKAAGEPAAPRMSTRRKIPLLQERFQQS